MTSEDADKAQQWAGMNGSAAWHLIERHADVWEDIAMMMDAWLRANVLAEREACGEIANQKAAEVIAKNTHRGRANNAASFAASMLEDVARTIQRRSNAGGNDEA